MDKLIEVFDYTKANEISRKAEVVSRHTRELAKELEAIELKDTLSKPITKYKCLNCGHRETQYTFEYKDIVVCPKCQYGALVDSYKSDLYLNHPEQSFGKGNYICDSKG